MADSELKDLTAIAALDPADLLYVIDDPSVTPLSRKITMEDTIKAGMGLTSANIVGVRVILHDETLASAGRFDVSSIPATYDHLELILLARSDVAATVDGVSIIFNADNTATNYFKQTNSATEGTRVVSEGATNAEGTQVPGASSPASSFAMMHAKIRFYASTACLKIITTEWVAMEQTTVPILKTGLVATVWEDGGATAINQITLQPDGYATDKFVAGSRLQIIGVKSSG